MPAPCTDDKLLFHMFLLYSTTLVSKSKHGLFMIRAAAAVAAFTMLGARLLLKALSTFKHNDVQHNCPL